FHPVILFHNNDKNDSSAILYGDPYYRPMIQMKKERMDQMLQTNSKWWQYITHTSPPPSPLQHRQSLSKPHSPDRHYYQQQQPLRKRRGNLPKTVTAVLKQWLIDHCQHPYPTEEEKIALRNKTGLTLNQISNWFINARRRILPLILV
ncbi:homeobox KN domain-containing protein, partial [Fennellomyces sp. T-0311]